MILKSLKLDNIRSYTSQQITFPEGSTLLAGDIGAGKSTILLAIEFALFGILRGDLSGSTLLRHGKNSGEVELTFEIEGKQVTIKRGLKRSKDNVGQDYGYIITDGMKKDATPVELKSSILNLLGYPDELLTKSKSLIYRYTVYTPQEEMKHILFEDKESRIDTLRKVFNIDKYKKMAENAEIVAKSIKDKRKEFAAYISDLDSKQKHKEQLNQEISFAQQNVNTILPKIEIAVKQLNEKKKAIAGYEEQINQLNLLKKKQSTTELDIKNKEEQLARFKKDILESENQISAMKNELMSMKIPDPAIIEKIKTLSDELFRQDTRKERARHYVYEHTAKRKEAVDRMGKVDGIEQCPMCMQEVSHDHKSKIREKEEALLKELEEQIKRYQEDFKQEELSYAKLKDDVEKMKDEQRNIELYRMKDENITEKQKRLEIAKIGEESLSNGLKALQSERSNVLAELEKIKDVEESYKKARSEYEESASIERQLAIQKAAFEKESQSLQKQIAMLDEEIAKKLQVKERISKLGEMQNWVEEYFINAMDVMEKHVMARIHQEFSDVFKRWFELLMEDQTINARLDESFSPIIEQNGYETELNNLSGGEKTAVALAYRLALNRVINDVVSEIKTKDLLILDEPTDGFSAEQLEKVKEVLNQLDIKQLIVVSHENKIESFVDNIIRVNKNEHMSEILN